MKLFCNCDCKEELHELKMKMLILEEQMEYYTDDYWCFMSNRPSAPLKEVVRRIAKHLGMQVFTEPAKEKTYAVAFKKEQE